MGAIDEFMSHLVLRTGSNDCDYAKIEIVNDNAKLTAWSKSKSKVRRRKSCPVKGSANNTNKKSRWNNATKTSNSNSDTLFSIVRPRNTYINMTSPTSCSSSKKITAMERQSAALAIVNDQLSVQEQSKDAVGLQLIDVIQKLSLKAALVMTRDHLQKTVSSNEQIQVNRKEEK